MKIRFLLGLVGLAISFALPTFAQQKEPTPSDENRQVSAALIKQSEDAWNKNDAAALAAMFTEDAVIVTDSGPVYGREAIEKCTQTCSSKSISATTSARMIRFPLTL
jgi:ketosteroid isomerase-like protein